MKKRSLPKMFLLFVVTFGVYRLYWLYKTRQEIVAAGHKAPRVIWFIAINALVFIATIMLIATSIYAGINQSNRVDECTNTSSMSKAECQKKVESEMNSSDITSLVSIGVFYLVIFIASPLIAVWYWKYSKGAEATTGGKAQFAMSMIVLLLIPDGFDMLIMQDIFNKTTTILTANLPTATQDATV